MWVLRRGYKKSAADISVAIRRLGSANVVMNRPAVEAGLSALEAGRDLVKEGRYREAAAVYAVTAPVANFSSRADDLYREIEKASPGTVRKFEPTPAPTPRGPPPPRPPA